MTRGGDAARDPTTVIALFSHLLPGYLVVLGVALVSNAIFGAAMIRAILHPTEEGLGFLRVGVDELRQLGLGLLTFAVFFGANVALLTVLGLIVAAIGGALNVTAGSAAMLMILGLICGTSYLAVRFSLAPALTFDSGRIDLLGSWSLTRGRFWPLLGAYGLTLALIMVIYLLSQLIILAFGAVLNGGDITAAATPPDMSSLAAYFTPWRLAQTAMTAGVSALVWPVLFTPPTAIYGLLTASGAPAAMRRA